MEAQDLDIVDESYELFSNTEGSQGGVDADAIAGAVDSTAQLIMAIQANQPEVKQELKARCGGKPWFGQEKKRLYEECKEDFFEQRAGVYDQGKNQDEFNYSSQYPPIKRGMSTGAIVGLSILGVAVLGTVIYFVRKNSIKATN